LQVQNLYLRLILCICKENIKTGKLGEATSVSPLNTYR
jgi:hypothetical protein